GGTVSPKFVLLRGREAEVFVGTRRRDAAARSAIEKPRLDEERFVDVFERVALFAEGRGEAGDADWTAVELVDDRPQQPPIHFVESVLVHFEQLERAAGDVRRDAPV